MFEKKIKYTDWDGNTREETFRFNLTQTEMLEIETEVPGGLQNYLTEIGEKVDGKKIMGFVKMFISKSYGEKDTDGKRFRKSPEISKAFEETQAYDELFSELVLDADKLVNFIKAVSPDEALIQKRLDNANIPAEILNQNGIEVVDTKPKIVENRSDSK